MLNYKSLEEANEMNDQIRRNVPLFSIRIAIQLTELTARQIRYYEEQKLILPARTSGNQRLFSMNDLDRLLEIKKLLEQGFNMKRIKELLREPSIFDKEIEILRQSVFTSEQKHVPINRGDLSRFYTQN